MSNSQAKMPIHYAGSRYALSRFCKRKAYGVASYLRDHASWEAVLPSPVEIACAVERDHNSALELAFMFSTRAASARIDQAGQRGQPENGLPVHVHYAACDGSTWVSARMETGVPQSKRQLVDVPRSQAGLSKAQL